MKLLAFYLPQFHQVPLNDEFWGEGYTEWVSVKNAKPLYEGHNQPREPLNDNYYNLLNHDTMQWQAKLMRDYDIDVLCFYHYWFAESEMVLEQPAENLLEWTDIDMPFCFSWANESWLSKWTNREGVYWAAAAKKKDGNGLIRLQTYRREEWKAHFDYLLPFFRDKRYIKIDNKPLFLIYQLDAIGCLEEMISFWQHCAKDAGFAGIYVVGNGIPYKKYGVDGLVINEPASTITSLKKDHCEGIPDRVSYQEAWEIILKRKYIRGSVFSQAGFLPYDNTPRYGAEGVVYESATLESIRDSFARLMAKNEALGAEWTCINAWNEWAEGMYLEPDKRNGYAVLSAIRDAKRVYSQYMNQFTEDTLYVGNDELRLGVEKAKMTTYFDIFNQWMSIREQGKRLTNYFLEHDVRKVLIYGAGYLTPHFIWECNLDGVSVVGIIDAQANHAVDDIPVFRMADKLPEADAIVVTACFHMHDILRTIRVNGSGIPVYSLYELIQLSEDME